LQAFCKAQVPKSELDYLGLIYLSGNFLRHYWNAPSEIARLRP